MRRSAEIVCRPRCRGLKERLERVRAQEYLTAWREDFEQVRVKRDALAAEFSEFYPTVVSQLIGLLCRMAGNDAEISRVHLARRTGVSLHLRTAELEARGLDRFTIYEPSIATELRLPHFDRSSASRCWLGLRRLPFSILPPFHVHHSTTRAIAPIGKRLPKRRSAGHRKAQDAAELASLEKAIAEAERLGGGATWWVEEQGRLKRLRAAVQASGG
jgi:hypothetical protein